MGCGCSVGPRLKDARLWEGSEGQPSARELLSWHLRMDVEAGAHSQLSCCLGPQSPQRPSDMAALAGKVHSPG